MFRRCLPHKISSHTFWCNSAGMILSCKTVSAWGKSIYSLFGQCWTKTSIRTGFLPSSSGWNFELCFLYHMHMTSELFCILQWGIHHWLKTAPLQVILSNFTEQRWARSSLLPKQGHLLGRICTSSCTGTFLAHLYIALAKCMLCQWRLLRSKELVKVFFRGQRNCPSSASSE